MINFQLIVYSRNGKYICFALAGTIKREKTTNKNTDKERANTPNKRHTFLAITIAGNIFNFALKFLKSERSRHVDGPKQLRRFQRAIQKLHTGMGKVAHYCCFIRGQVFEYLFQSHVQFKLCCRTAHRHCCQHSFGRTRIRGRSNNSDFKSSRALSAKPVRVEAFKVMPFNLGKKKYTRRKSVACPFELNESRNILLGDVPQRHLLLVALKNLGCLLCT